MKLWCRLGGGGGPCPPGLPPCPSERGLPTRPAASAPSSSLSVPPRRALVSGGTLDPLVAHPDRIGRRAAARNGNRLQRRSGGPPGALHAGTQRYRADRV